MSNLLDPTSRDDMIQFANSAWDSFDWEMNIAIPNQRQGNDGPMNDSQAKLDDWMEATGRELYEEVCPPDHIIIPRAEVEALRRDQNTLDICTDAFARLHTSQSALRVEYEALRALISKLGSVVVAWDSCAKSPKGFVMLREARAAITADELASIHRIINGEVVECS